MEVKVMNANCPKCQQQITFVSVGNKKYKCEKCNTVLHKCHKDGCINMVAYGWYCSKCVGRGLKDIGAGAVTVFAGLGIIAIKVLIDGKGEKNE
jgi:hypothetical protein